MASASPICLMACASSTKSWLWYQRLSHLYFDTINDLAKNDLVTGLQKFKYHKEYLCPSCEQGKSKRESQPPKPVPKSKQRLHLLHMDLCGPMRIASINGKRYVLVIVDDYSCYTWVHFLRSKDETPEVIKTFLKRITVLFQSPVIIIRTNNGSKFKNQVLKEYFDSIGISHQIRMIPEPGDTNREVPVNETFHVQTDDELTEKELKQIEADDQAIQTILLGLSEDIYAAVDSCETAQEIWLRVQQMMKGSDIGIQ
nr:putative ribonuclease H-like domain-containing protein [Tanacetum cinerariifolium]